MSPESVCKIYFKEQIDIPVEIMIIIFSSCQSLVHPIFMSCDVLELDYFTDPISLFAFLWGCLLNIKGKVMFMATYFVD